MDPITIISLAGAAIELARRAFETGELLAIFVNDVKTIDQTLKGLHSEVKALSAACELVGSRVKGIAEAIDRQNNAGIPGESESPLWVNVRTQLDDCSETISTLFQALKGLGKEKKNFFAQAWRQIQLDMKTKDIDEARNRIRSHTASLQLVLQAITLEVSYLGPHKADQQLFVLLENIRDIKQELGSLRETREQEITEAEKVHQQKENELIKYTDKIISSGETLYEESVAGGSVIGPSDGLNDKITSWVSRLQALSIDDTISESEEFGFPDFQSGSSVSGADRETVTDLTSDSGTDIKSRDLDSLASETVVDDGPHEDGDDMQTEMIREAFILGKHEFDAGEFKKADLLLQEVLTMVEESPVRSNGIVNVRDLRWMMAVCAYHEDDVETAEVALKEIVQIPPQTQEDRVRLCEAGHILALASLKQGKFNEARQYCDSALQGRRRLLGKQDKSCYDSLALLSRIFECQGNSARATIYSRMIPEDQRNEVCSHFKTLGTPVVTVGPSNEPPTQDDTMSVSDAPPPYVETDQVTATAGPSLSRIPSAAPSYHSSRPRPPIPTATPVYASEERSEYRPPVPEKPPPAIPRHSSLNKRPIPNYPVDEKTAATAIETQKKTPAQEIDNKRRQLEKSERDSGTKSVQAIEALRNFANAIHESDASQPNAEKLHEEVLQHTKGVLDSSDPTVYKTWAGLAQIAESHEDWTRASELYQKVLSAMKKNPDHDVAFRSKTQSMLAECFVHMKKPDRAYSMLREELRLRRKLHGGRLRSDTTAECAKRLKDVKVLLRNPGSYLS